MKLNDKICKNAKPKEKAYKLYDGGGLYLEITKKGNKLWRLKYRLLGKEKRLALGVYPEVTLQMARNKRLEARRLLDQGIDPGQEKKKRKRQREIDAANTFKVGAVPAN